MKKKIVAAALTVSLATPAMAFFNPMSMMGSMMGSMASPVISQMTSQMLGTMEQLMENKEFRSDMANFMLGTADEAIFQMMSSLQNGDETFVGALAEVALTNGADRGTPEYNQAMGFWMTKFGPAMQSRMAQVAEMQAEQEAAQEAQAEAQAQQDAYNADMQRRQQLNVYRKYNFDTQEYELMYMDGWDERLYIPGES